MTQEYFDKNMNLFLEEKCEVDMYNLAHEYVAELELKIEELKQWYADLDYKFSCVLDNATGGRASKPSIDLNVAYELISANVNFWVESAVDEVKDDKSCDGCKWLTMDKMELIMVHRFHGCFVCSRRRKDNYEPKEEI